MASDSDFMMTAEEIRLKKLKRRRILIASVAMVLFLIAGFFGGRPTLNAIKAWQARRHADKAFAYIEQENWLQARGEAVAAYQLRPTEPQAVRAVARFLSRTRQPDALGFWEQLEKLTPLTREDRQDEAAIAMAADETTRAETAVHSLIQSNDVDATSWLLATQLAIRKGVADDAMSALQKIFADPRATEQQQLHAALLELTLASDSQGIDERVTDAWSRIEKISKGKSATALDALVLLARKQLTASSKEQGAASQNDSATSELQAPSSDLADRLENHPLTKAPHKLLALDLQEHADAARRDELIAQGIAQFKNGDTNDLLALATWLNEKKEFEKTLEGIPLEKAVQARELFLQYLDALGGLDRWSEIKQLLENERYPLDPVTQHMYLARCNAQLNEKTAAENNWQRALEAAAGDRGKLVMLGEYAEKNGLDDVAKSAFETAVQQSPRLRIAQQGRLRIAQRTGDTKKIHAVLAGMLKIWPNDPAVQNDEAYTRLLLMGSNAASTPSSGLQAPSSDLDEVVKLAANLVVKNPRSMPHRTLLALAYLKENRPADALVVYKDITVARSALTPSALAVHAAVLAADGRKDEARAEAAQVKPEQLLPEERQLIADLKRDLPAKTRLTTNGHE